MTGLWASPSRINPLTRAVFELSANTCEHGMSFSGQMNSSMSTGSTSRGFFKGPNQHQFHGIDVINSVRLFDARELGFRVRRMGPSREDGG
jgi:hypothetical protein